MRLPRLLPHAFVLGGALLLLAILLLGPSHDEADKVALCTPSTNRSAAQIEKEQACEKGQLRMKDGKKAIDTETPREKIVNAGCEMQEAADVLLTPQLFGNKCGVTPPDVFPAAKGQAE